MIVMSINLWYDASMHSLGMRHIALKVRDAQASKRFYTEVMGMAVEWEPDPKNVYLTSGGQDNLALHEVAAKDSPSGTQGLDHFGFFTGCLDDVDAWYKRVEASGAIIIQAVKTHRDHSRSFYFKDPDGYVIQILYHAPLIGNSHISLT